MAGRNDWGRRPGFNGCRPERFSPCSSSFRVVARIFLCSAAVASERADGSNNAPVSKDVLYYVAGTDLYIYPREVDNSGKF